jgi:hypoxanthine phosphoribosyltransferase
MSYKEVLEDILKKKDRKEGGKFNGIPFPFDRFRDYITDIEPGSYIGILGASGVGKSKLTRNVFLYHPLNFSITNNYPVKILYFALEDPKKKIYKNMICHYLYIRHKYSIPLTKLESKGDYILPQEAIDLIRKDEQFYDWIDKNVLIIDDCVTPDTIEAKCDHLRSRIDKEEHVIVIIDNYANLVPDEGKKDWDAVRYFSRNIVRLKLCKEYNWTVIGVLQEDIETEKNRFRSIAGGRTAIGSIEPNGSSIGNAKIVIQDLFYAIGIFNPWKYELTKYPNNKGYDINILRNNFRGINIFKNNEGDVGGRLGLFFDRHEIFRQMPRTEDEVTLKKIYDKILEEERERLLKGFVQKGIF